MVSNALLVVSVAALGVALLSGAHAVLEHGVRGLRWVGPGTYAALGVYALSFGGFLLTQGG